MPPPRSILTAFSAKAGEAATARMNRIAPTCFILCPLCPDHSFPVRSMMRRCRVHFVNCQEVPFALRGPPAPARLDAPHSSHQFGRGKGNELNKSFVRRIFPGVLKSLGSLAFLGSTPGPGTITELAIDRFEEPRAWGATR